jgi:hypothetical protein
VAVEFDEFFCLLRKTRSGSTAIPKTRCVQIRPTINEFSATPRLTIPASFFGDHVLLNMAINLFKKCKLRFPLRPTARTQLLCHDRIEFRRLGYPFAECGRTAHDDRIGYSLMSMLFGVCQTCRAFWFVDHGQIGIYPNRASLSPVDPTLLENLVVLYIESESSRRM